MANRIRDVRIINHRLDPHETELRIVVELDELTAATTIKGRLMGPRNAYCSTIEVAYPFREIVRDSLIMMRVVIPEASWWEPQTPFLYEGPLELWQDGQLCDKRSLSHAIRMLQESPTGYRLNGKPLVLNSRTLNQPLDETLARQWHNEGVNTLLVKCHDDIRLLANRFGFLLMDAAPREVREQPDHYCRVCGLDQGFPIWGENGTDPSWEICDCCGSEFGYEDCLPRAARNNRQRWISQGANWFEPTKKPENWDLERQLENVPEGYR